MLASALVQEMLTCQRVASLLMVTVSPAGQVKGISSVQASGFIGWRSMSSPVAESVGQPSPSRSDQARLSDGKASPF